MKTSVSDMSFQEYEAHLKTLPFFERMATMKVYGSIMLDKVVGDCLADIKKGFDNMPEAQKSLLFPRE